MKSHWPSGIVAFLFEIIMGDCQKMNLNEKKKKMQIIKIRNVFDSFLNYVYVRGCAFLIFFISMTFCIFFFLFYI